MELRPFAEADRQAAVVLWHRCGLVRPWNDPDRDIDAKLAHDPDGFIVATTGAPARHLVGTVMVGYEGHRGWVNHLGVDPAHRRAGLGRRLVDAAEAHLRARGCPKLNLQVRAGNSGALAFYERLGYAVDDVVSMGKRLDR